MSLAGVLATGKGRWIVALITLAIAGGLFGGGGYLGWQLCAGEQAETENARLRELQADLREQQARNLRLAEQLEMARNEIRVEYRTIEKEVPRVVTRYIPASDAPARDLPACPVTRGFVRVWNDALAGMSSAAGESADAAAGTDPVADLRLADGIGRREILTNHIRNGEQCRLVRQQLQALIEWHRSTDNTE